MSTIAELKESRKIKRSKSLDISNKPSLVLRTDSLNGFVSPRKKTRIEKISNFLKVTPLENYDVLYAIAQKKFPDAKKHTLMKYTIVNQLRLFYSKVSGICNRFLAMFSFSEVCNLNLIKKVKVLLENAILLELFCLGDLIAFEDKAGAFDWQRTTIDVYIDQMEHPQDLVDLFDKLEDTNLVSWSDHIQRQNILKSYMMSILPYKSLKIVHTFDYKIMEYNIAEQYDEMNRCIQELDLFIHELKNSKTQVCK